MSLKTIISRWLDPEAHEKAERYWRLRSYLDDAQRWLGYEWPEVDQAIFWAKVSEVNHFRKLGAPVVEAVPGLPGIHGIDQFRQHLREARQALGDKG